MENKSFFPKISIGDLRSTDWNTGRSYDSNVMRCAIWYHLYNLKNVENTHRGVLRFLNCTNGTKSRKASHMTPSTKHEYLIYQSHI